MLRHERSAPIWLFSFVDLAFLLLIAFTQIDPDRAFGAIDVASLELPRIHGPGTPRDGKPPAPPWQLRIHPAPTPAEGTGADEAPAHAPFALIEPGTRADSTAALDLATLSARLEVLATRRLDKPMLTPHRDARAEDLLRAAALVDALWSGPRPVAVLPDGASPPVAARSDDADARSETAP